MWAVVFFFFLEGTTDPELANWVRNTWIGLLIGVTLLAFAAPEFFHYQSQCAFLMQILESPSRADVGRQRKEAQEAANLLGEVWSARLDAHLIELGLLRSRKAPDAASRGVPEDLLIRWWGTCDSRLSRWVGIEGLQKPAINRTLGTAGFVLGLLQAVNMAFGLVRNAAGDRVNTLLVWEWLNGARIDSVAAPHATEPLGILVLLLGLGLLWATCPAPGDRLKATEEEE